MKNLILTVVIIFFACDAPRDNPFDPNNPDSELRSIFGKIQTVSIPFVAVPAAEVFWENDQLSVFSDVSGNYSIKVIQGTNGWIFVQKSGYFADSVYIEWSIEKSMHVDFFLNSIASAENVEMYSSIVNRYPNLQTEYLDISAQIFDRDGDTDSVLISNQDLGIRQELLYNVPGQTYERTFSIFELGITRLEELVGYPFQIEVRDEFGHWATPAIADLVRVIREEIFFTAPSGNDSTSSRPTLEWKRFDPGFPLTYTLEVFSSEITPQLLWFKTGIVQDSVTYTVDQNLDPGNYFWVIWAVDEFQNRVRSKPASFRVGQ